MVAIAAYYALLGGQSVERHPLVKHFLCGAQRLRTPVCSRVTSCSHRTHKSTELPCGGSLTNRLFAMVLPKGVFLLPSRPLAGGYSSLGVNAHSTWSVAASKAFLSGVPHPGYWHAAGWSNAFSMGMSLGHVCNHGSPMVAICPASPRVLPYFYQKLPLTLPHMLLSFLVSMSPHPWRLTPPLDWLYTWFRAWSRWMHSHCVLTQRLVPSGDHVYIRNLGTFDCNVQY